MPTKHAVRKTRAVKKKVATDSTKKTRMMLRFADSDQHSLVCKAQQKSGITSLNGWIIQALLKQAQKELKA